MDNKGFRLSEIRHILEIYASAKNVGIVFMAIAWMAGIPKAQADTSSENAIRADLNLYTPGTIPQGIGEPVKAAQDLADIWEEAHRGKKIRFQQLVSAGNSEGEWLKTQLLGGVAPEIINQNAEVAWPDVDKGWYVPLDEYLEKPNPYVPGNTHWIDIFKNKALINAKRAPNGKLYGLSIDIVETGVFYNKDILEFVGVSQFPKTWEEMIELCKKLQQKDITPFTAECPIGSTLASDWGQDIIFEMLYHSILKDMDLIPSSSAAEAYLDHYLEPSEAGFLFTKGFFTKSDPRWREMHRILKDWRRYWAKEIKNTDPIRLFLTKRVAMYWTGSWFIRRMTTDPYIDFRWGIGYIPAITSETSPYASGTPATVIGGAAIQLHVTNSAMLNGNLDDCMDFLMYITAPKNLEQLTSEAKVYIPNVEGARMQPDLQPFEDIFQRRYCAIKWLDSMDGRYKKEWRRMMDDWLNDGITLEEYLGILEQNFAGWAASHMKENEWDFSKMETVWQERGVRLASELKN